MVFKESKFYVFVEDGSIIIFDFFCGDFFMEFVSFIMLFECCDFEYFVVILFG